MNIIQRWKQRRRNRRESEAINARQLEQERLEAAKAALKAHVERVVESMNELEFKVMNARTTNSTFTCSTMIAIGADKRVYSLSVYVGGGYELEPLIKN